MRFPLFKSLALATLVTVSGFAMAADAPAEAEYTLVIKDHIFTPAELTVPANTAFKLIVKNDDATPEEFESHSLKLEKIIPANSSATFKIRGKKAGTYKFFGEFNEKTAHGVLTVK